MRNAGLALLLVLLGFPSYAADPAEEAKSAEAAFAKAFADRDADKFFSFVADDANFFGGKKMLSGKNAVRESWSRFFTTKDAPFSWEPERVAANAAGNLVMTYGPVHDPKGELIGYFTSVWQKQGDGSWKVLFDGPGGNPPCPPPAPPAAPAPPTPSTPPTPPDPPSEHGR